MLNSCGPSTKLIGVRAREGEDGVHGINSQSLVNQRGRTRITNPVSLRSSQDRNAPERSSNPCHSFRPAKPSRGSRPPTDGLTQQFKRILNRDYPSSYFNNQYETSRELWRIYNQRSIVFSLLDLTLQRAIPTITRRTPSGH